MKLSRTVGYALQAALQLAQAEPGELIPCSRLAAEGSMPERFLLQILRGLVAHGILASTRGVDGGYRLDRLPQNISLLEVIEAIDGPLNPILPLADKLPTNSRAKLESTLNNVTQTARKELDAVKLSDLLPPVVRSRFEGNIHLF